MESFSATQARDLESRRVRRPTQSGGNSRLENANNGIGIVDGLSGIATNIFGATQARDLLEARRVRPSSSGGGSRLENANNAIGIADGLHNARRPPMRLIFAYILVWRNHQSLTSPSYSQGPNLSKSVQDRLRSSVTGDRTLTMLAAVCDRQVGRSIVMEKLHLNLFASRSSD